MFKVSQPREAIEKKLRKCQKLNYNVFRWWRWYQAKNTPLPNKADFRDKIFNGDFDPSCYGWQAMLCEHMINDIELECLPDLQKFIENSSMLKRRRKRLWEDYEKDEFNRLDSLYTHFTKNFHIEKEQVIEECLKCSGEIIDLYYIIEDKYIKQFKVSGRGRPKKQYA
tara:strand:- start:705 stop:1208 length:504 start_codon:yes stop_codon:yes gene_type:complete